MKDLFTKENCDCVSYGVSLLSLIPSNNCILLETANKIFHDWVAQQTVVYGREGSPWYQIGGFHTHTGRIFDIRPIEKDTAEKIVRDLVNLEKVLSADVYHGKHSEILSRAKALVGK